MPSTRFQTLFPPLLRPHAGAVALSMADNVLRVLFAFLLDNQPER